MCRGIIASYNLYHPQRTNVYKIVLTQSQEIQKKKDTAAMLVHKNKGDQKIPLLNVHQNGVNDVR